MTVSRNINENSITLYALNERVADLEAQMLHVLNASASNPSAQGQSLTWVAPGTLQVELGQQFGAYAPVLSFDRGAWSNDASKRVWGELQSASMRHPFDAGATSTLTIGDTSAKVVTVTWDNAIASSFSTTELQSATFDNGNSSVSFAAGDVPENSVGTLVPGIQVGAGTVSPSNNYTFETYTEVDRQTVGTGDRAVNSSGTQRLTINTQYVYLNQHAENEDIFLIGREPTQFEYFQAGIGNGWNAQPLGPGTGEVWRKSSTDLGGGLLEWRVTTSGLQHDRDPADLRISFA